MKLEVLSVVSTAKKNWSLGNEKEDFFISHHYEYFRKYSREYTPYFLGRSLYVGNKIGHTQNHESYLFA